MMKLIFSPLDETIIPDFQQEKDNFSFNLHECHMTRSQIMTKHFYKFFRNVRHNSRCYFSFSWNICSSVPIIIISDQGTQVFFFDVLAKCSPRKDSSWHRNQPSEQGWQVINTFYLIILHKNGFLFYIFLVKWKNWKSTFQLKF